MVHFRVFTFLFILTFSAFFSSYSGLDARAATGQLSSTFLCDDFIEDPQESKASSIDEAQENLSWLVHQVIMKVSRINYYNTRYVILDGNDFGLKGLAFNIVIDLQCKGSGPAMLPLTAPTVTMRPKKNRKRESDVDADFSLKGFLKVVMQNELKKNAGELPILKRFASISYQPIHLFVLKLALLFKAEHNNMGRFVAEASRLMVRMYQSNPSMFLQNGELSSSLLTEMLEASLSFILPESFAESIKVLSCGDGTAVQENKVVLFNKACEDKAKFVATLVQQRKAFTEITAFIKKLQDVHNIAFEQSYDFELFLNANKNKRPSDPAKRLYFIGTRSFVARKLAGASFLLDKASVGEYIADSAETGFHMVVLPPGSLGVRETICSLVGLTIRALHEYVTVKFSVGKTPSDREVRNWEAEAQERAELIGFLRTDEGQCVKARLEEQIKSICSAKEDKFVGEAKGAPASAQDIEKLEQEIKGLEAVYKKAQADADAWSTFPPRTEVLKRAVAQRVAAAAQAQERLKEKQFELEQAYSVVIAKENTSAEEAKRLQTLEKLEKDLAFVRESICEAHYSGDDDDKYTQLAAHLEEQIDQLKGCKSIAITTLQECCAIRERAAQCYDDEAEVVVREIQERQRQLLYEEKLADGGNQLALLRARRVYEFIEVYANYLHKLAQRVRDENKDIQELIELQELAAMDGLTNDQLRNMKRLSVRYGYLVQTPFYGLILNIDDAVFSIDLYEIVSDLTGNDERFAKVRDMLELGFGSILGESSFIKGNEPVYNYLVEKFVPAPFVPYLDISPRSSVA